GQPFPTDRTTSTPMARYGAVPPGTFPAESKRQMPSRIRRSTMPHVRRLLVPHDLSDYADQALAMAAELAGPTGDLLVLHAIVPFVPTAEVAIATQVP